MSNMDPGCKKIYGSHEHDTKSHFENLYSPHAPYSVYKETTMNMIQAIYKAFNTGKITGKTAIHFCSAPIIVALLPMKDFVQEITVLEASDASLIELEKWKNKDPAAFDWSHTTEVFKQLKGNSDEFVDEEEELRRKIKNILKWDPCKENPEDSLQLPMTDIVASIWFLETISKDQKDYRRNLRKFYNLIKLGGYLLLYALINSSYFTAGEHKIHLLSCDESFYRKVLCEEGFEIKHFVNFDRGMCVDHIDHEGTVCIVAQKVKEP